MGGRESSSNTESDTDISAEGCGSPRMQRRRRHKQFRAEKVERSITFRTLDELMYNDNLPESSKLVEVTSNIWGTKFQLIGVASYLPEFLGNVVYKTSLLHLQPRQMTITLTEVGGSSQALSRDPNFTPAGAPEDDEDSSTFSDTNDCDLFPDILKDKNGFETEVPMANQICVDVQQVVETGNHVENYTNSVNGVANYENYNAGILPKLTHTGSIRSKPLSPVLNSFSKPSTSPVKTDSNQDGIHPPNYDNQGARPKFISGMQTLFKFNGQLEEVFDSPNGLKTDAKHSPKVTMSENNSPVTSSAGDSPRWADPASTAIKYMDEELPDNSELPFENNLVGDCSPTAPCHPDLHRRLYLAQQKSVELEELEEHGVHMFAPSEDLDNSALIDNSVTDVIYDKRPIINGSIDRGINAVHTILQKDHLFSNGSDIEILQSASLPASPIRCSKLDSPTRKLREEVLKGKCKHLSPMFKRRSKHQSHIDSSEEDLLLTIEKINGGSNYKNLETFQKSQLKQKVENIINPKMTTKKLPMTAGTSTTVIAIRVKPLMQLITGDESELCKKQVENVCQEIMSLGGDNVVRSQEWFGNPRNHCCSTLLIRRDCLPVTLLNDVDRVFGLVEIQREDDIEINVTDPIVAPLYFDDSSSSDCSSSDTEVAPLYFADSSSSDCSSSDTETTPSHFERTDSSSSSESDPEQRIPDNLHTTTDDGNILEDIGVDVEEIPPIIHEQILEALQVRAVENENKGVRDTVHIVKEASRKKKITPMKMRLRSRHGKK